MSQTSFKNRKNKSKNVFKPQKISKNSQNLKFSLPNPPPAGSPPQASGEQGWLFQWPTDNQPPPYANLVPFLPPPGSPLVPWPQNFSPRDLHFFPPQIPANNMIFSAEKADFSFKKESKTDKNVENMEKSPKNDLGLRKEPKMGRNLKTWCKNSLKELGWAEQWPVLEECSRLETSDEVKKRVLAEYGDSVPARAFADQFYKQREFYRNQVKFI